MEVLVNSPLNIITDRTTPVEAQLMVKISSASFFGCGFKPLNDTHKKTRS